MAVAESIEKKLDTQTRNIPISGLIFDPTDKDFSNFSGFVNLDRYNPNQVEGFLSNPDGDFNILGKLEPKKRFYIGPVMKGNKVIGDIYNFGYNPDFGLYIGTLTNENSKQYSACKIGDSLQRDDERIARSFLHTMNRIGF